MKILNIFRILVSDGFRKAKLWMVSSIASKKCFFKNDFSRCCEMTKKEIIKQKFFPNFFCSSKVFEFVILRTLERSLQRAVEF